MARHSSGGTILTVNDISEVAVRIGEMWTTYNVARRNALILGEEARQYVFATDIDGTAASILPHKNRTHQPKLTEISDNLQSQYWDATLSLPDFFKFEGSKNEDHRKSTIIEDWVRTKLEQKKFRQGVGRQLLADFVTYGNSLATVDYIHEVNEFGQTIYKGPLISRTSPLDNVFDPRAKTFSASPKITRFYVHVSDLKNWPNEFPLHDFKESVIDKAVQSRQTGVVDDWIEVLKAKGITLDGYNTFNEYFRQDMVEVLVYRGPMFDPDTAETQRHRIIYVIDQVHVIRNSPNTAPKGFDGLHHAGWRVRNDNIWAQGPLDNLVGMQYRIDHLENLKADVFDIIAHPTILIKGENVQEPEEGFGPGAVYYMGLDEDVKMLAPDVTALNADNQIATYHRLMEQFAGSPPETRGIRTPGEKTAFEVGKLDANATKMFVDKARQFEMFLESILLEAFYLMIKNFDSVDFMKVFNDPDALEEFEEIQKDDIEASGVFVAIGSRHWSRRNRETVEMRDFQLGPMQDPKIRAHVSGEKLAEFYEKRLGIEDAEIIEPFIGVKEDVRIQAVAQAEAEKFKQDSPAGSGEPGDEEQPDAEEGAISSPLESLSTGPQTP